MVPALANINLALVAAKREWKDIFIEITAYNRQANQSISRLLQLFQSSNSSNSASGTKVSGLSGYQARTIASYWTVSSVQAGIFTRAFSVISADIPEIIGSSSEEEDRHTTGFCN